MKSTVWGALTEAMAAGLSIRFGSPEALPGHVRREWDLGFVEIDVVGTDRGSPALIITASTTATEVVTYIERVTSQVRT